jgi:hypothetical protein
MPLLPSLRPFGAPADLGIDFGQPDRPALVTALLAGCSGGLDAAHWWAQPVGVRTAALLALVRLGDGARAFELAARCDRPACGAPVEFPLPIDALLGMAEAGPIRVALGDARTVTLRRPTGDDLRAWRAAAPATREQAVETMLGALLIEGEVRTQDQARLSEAVAAHDPLVDFAVACTCPACGAAFELALDLEALALARLAGRQRALLREVHRFASAYGWSEGAVLALPAGRRAAYLALIEEVS